MTVRASSRLGTAKGSGEVAAIVRAHCEPLPSVDEADAFGEAFDAFGAAKLVLLGEATHGTSEFYRARAAITRRLIERHGFNIVAVEADWPDAARIDRHVRQRRHEPAGAEAFARFPTWMWRNQEVHDFIEWLRLHNEGLPSLERVQFSGLDIYSLGASIAAVLAYLDRVDPEEAKAARGRYACLTPWQDDPVRYGRATYRLDRSPCEDEVVVQLRELLDNRLDYLSRDRNFFDAEQNARIVHAAENYYRLMYRSATDSWNLRDRHMFDTLTRLLAARGTRAKAVVWAHNSHIGNAAATAMGWEGEFNLGESCRAAFGDRAVLVGFGTDRGSVAAADDWDGPMRIATVLPARPDSYEHVFRQTFVETSLTTWRGDDKSELRQALAVPRLERAIGVVYHPETELTSHYFKAILPDQFDAYAWFEQTTAVAPLVGPRPHGAPDTYPFGL
jgi:erythromycin esterase-like protein